MNDVPPSIYEESWERRRDPTALRVLLTLGQERGIAPAACLAGTGLRLSKLDEPSARVQPAQELAAIRNLVALTEDEPGLGTEAGTRFQPSTLGAFGLTMLSSRSVRELLRIAQRFSSLTWGMVPRVMIERADIMLATLEEDAIAPDIRDFVVERDIAFAVTVLDTTVGAKCPLVVETTMPLTRLDALQTLLGPRPLEAGQPKTRISWTRETLDARLGHGDAIAIEVCIQQCEVLQQRLAAQPPSGGVAAWVEGVLMRLPPERWHLDDVARERHVHPRTLKRLLASENTTFRTVVEARREALARALLRDTDLSVAQIAVRVGYTETASFTKAFKRWTGRTPIDARRERDRAT